MEDGRVRLRFDATEIMLRRPKLKEYRQLKASASEANGRIQRLKVGQDEHGTDRLVNEHDEPTEVDEIVTPLIREVVEVLGDHPLPGDEDLPPWLVVSGDPVSQMLIHWRSVPLGRGLPAPPR
jgi:hypothetical protein